VSSSDPKRPRIILFSGLGGDDRLVAPQYGVDADVEIRPWLPIVEGESLASYAKRLAAAIDPSPPFYLGGVSLGGMLALEAAQYLHPKGLILLAACRSYEGIPWPYRWAGRLAWVAPLWMVQLGKLIMPHVRRLFGIISKEQVQFFVDMLADADPRFIRWSIQAMLTWHGVPRIDVPLLSIHGDRDRILPLHAAGPINYVVEGAGHVMNVTHAAEVNRVITQWLHAVETAATHPARDRVSLNPSPSPQGETSPPASSRPAQG
jgi:pimeloyl-ACP methyl ester carboxylesterase